MDVPPSSPRIERGTTVDVEMGAIPESSFARLQPNAIDGRRNGEIGIASSASSVPEGIRSFWSTKIFRTVMFFLFCFSVFGVCTSLLYTDKISNEQFLGMCSSLLFLLSPSPLDLIKSKKKK
jgi:hypothetical protein